ncbi:hypothetical protein Plec18170_004974 [Paecilomyces lecythidis]
MATSTPNRRVSSTPVRARAPAASSSAARSPPRSTPPASTPRTINLFTQLKTIAESGCKINPSLYYDFPGYAEHTLQFSVGQYALLTDGLERPDFEWERACQIHLARKNIPQELVTLPLSDARANSLAAAAVAARTAGSGRGGVGGSGGVMGGGNDPNPSMNKYIMAGVPRMPRAQRVSGPEGSGSGSGNGNGNANSNANANVSTPEKVLITNADKGKPVYYVPQRPYPGQSQVQVPGPGQKRGNVAGMGGGDEETTTTMATPSSTISSIGGPKTP